MLVSSFYAPKKETEEMFIEWNVLYTIFYFKLASNVTLDNKMLYQRSEIKQFEVKVSQVKITVMIY